MDKPDILKRIEATKREEVRALTVGVGMESALAQAREAREKLGPPRGFARALISEQGVSIIAEIKKASPSKGLIRPDFDPELLAREYDSSPAAAISVLTDKPYFQGDLEFIPLVRKITSKPVLRKDFIIDPIQVAQSVIAGADAVLLIVALLDHDALVQLHRSAREWGLDVLVEVHDRSEMEAAIELGAELIGINNRDLRTFEVDLGTSLELAPMAAGKACLVAESGIFSRQDVEKLAPAGIDAVLVGESIMRQANVSAHIANLRGHELNSNGND